MTGYLNKPLQRHSGQLDIGASTTVAQYVLPPVLAAFNKKFDSIRVALSIDNTNQTEQALQDQVIDLGIIERRSKSKRKGSYNVTRFAS